MKKKNKTKQKRKTSMAIGKDINGIKFELEILTKKMSIAEINII